MSSGASQQPLVLEYSKRRFDGGNEREIIEQIEMHYQVYEQQKQQAGIPVGVGVADYPEQAINPIAYSVGNPLDPVAISAHHLPDPNRKLTIKEKLYKAFIMPYIEFFLGISGVLVGSIMLVTLMRGAALSADVLVREREALLEHSWIVVRNSIAQMIVSPLVALKLLLVC